MQKMSMRPSVTYKTCATSSKEQTGDIITLAQFEEGGLFSETYNNAESVDESNDRSIIPPLLSEEEMDAMNSGNCSYDDPMSTEMVEYICDGSQSHPNVNRRETRYKIRDSIKQRQLEWKGALQPMIWRQIDRKSVV